MGLPMARNLLAAGHDVVGLDLDAERMTELGGRAAASVTDAVDGVEAVFTSLPHPDAVARVAREVGGAAPSGSVFVDVSTGPPGLARELERELAEHGLDALDA